MTAGRATVLALLGAALLAGGFLIGHSLGEDRDAPEFGSALSTLTTEAPDTKVPGFTAAKELPALAVTTAEVEPVDGEVAEPIEDSGTVAPVVQDKPEKNEPPVKPTPPPEPDITVGTTEE